MNSSRNLIRMVGQVNGKDRGHLDALTNARSNAASHLDSKTIVKQILVHCKIVNFVVR